MIGITTEYKIRPARSHIFRENHVTEYEGVQTGTGGVDLEFPGIAFGLTLIVLNMSRGFAKSLLSGGHIGSQDGYAAPGNQTGKDRDDDSGLEPLEEVDLCAVSLFQHPQSNNVGC